MGTDPSKTLADTDPYFLVALVSYGPVMCGHGRVGINTNVAYYMKWILDNVEKN